RAPCRRARLLPRAGARGFDPARDRPGRGMDGHGRRRDRPSHALVLRARRVLPGASGRCVREDPYREAQPDHQPRAARGAPRVSDAGNDAPIGARFRLGRLGRLIACRSLPGLAAIALAARGREEAAMAGLLLAVAADVAVSSLAARRGWIETASDVEIEGF